MRLGELHGIDFFRRGEPIDSDDGSFAFFSKNRDDANGVVTGDPTSE